MRNIRIINKGKVKEGKAKIVIWCKDNDKKKYFTLSNELYSEIKAMVRNNYFKDCDELISYIISRRFNLDIKPIEKLELNLNEEKTRS